MESSMGTLRVARGDVRPRRKKSAAHRARRSLRKSPGGVLLSHTLSGAVPSALEGLTALFGMGRGVAPPPSPPGIRRQLRQPKTSTTEIREVEKVRGKRRKRFRS